MEELENNLALIEAERIVDNFLADEYAYPNMCAKYPPAARSQLMEIKKMLDHYQLSMNDINQFDRIYAVVPLHDCEWLNEAIHEFLVEAGIYPEELTEENEREGAP